MTETKKNRVIKRVRLFGLYIYVSTGKMKLRCGSIRHKQAVKNGIRRNRSALAMIQGGACQMCGSVCENMELHHILPVSQYPELATELRNSVLLCPECHKEVHRNVLLNARMMMDKAAELGVELFGAAQAISNPPYCINR